MRTFPFMGFVLSVVTVVAFWVTTLVPSRAGSSRAEGGVKGEVIGEQREYSFSYEQSRRFGKLITKVRMTPATATWGKSEIAVGDAWLEKGKQGGYYLCFRIDKGMDALDLRPKRAMFVMEDTNGSVGMVWGGDPEHRWMQGAQYLDSPDLSKARFSIIGNFREKRLKNIQFVPIDTPEAKKLFQVRARLRSRIPQKAPVFSVAFSPDGKTLAYLVTAPSPKKIRK